MVDSPFPDTAFGKTGLRVTTLCVGGAPLGDMPETFAYSVPEESALETIRTAFRSPIRFIDTAASYGDGESERRIGAVIKEIGGLPAGYVLATKADRNLQTGDFSGAQMRRSVERSLFLLGLDRLQIVHLHDPEHGSFEEITAPGGALEALVRMKEEGIVGALGVAGGPIDMEIRYVELGVFDAVVTHNRYTLLNRTAEPLIELAAQRGLAVLNAAPYGSGMLAKGPEAYARYAYQDAPPEMVERARRMEEVCARFGVPLAAAALQFSLRDPRITSTVVGMSRPERIWQTLELARHPIPGELWPQLDAAGYEGSAEGQLDPERRRWESGT
jgi:D-threo-aldose 1-dehydrogenase